MSADPKARGGLKVLGLGALACIGCCAGPVLAFLGGLSIAGLASTVLIGGAGLVVATAAAVGYLIVRRRRALACKVTYADSVAVAPPTNRTTDDPEEVAVP